MGVSTGCSPVRLRPSAAFPVHQAGRKRRKGWAYFANCAGFASNLVLQPFEQK